MIMNLPDAMVVIEEQAALVQELREEIRELKRLNKFAQKRIDDLCKAWTAEADEKMSNFNQWINNPLKD